MTLQEAREKFSQTLRRARYLQSAGALLEWDLRTIAPPKSAADRAQAAGAVAAEAFRLETSAEFGDLIACLKDNRDQLDAKEAAMLRVASSSYERFRRIPVELYEEFQVATSESSTAWEKAKHENDFAAFRPHLQKMIDYSRRFVELWGYEESPYDALLEDYEPGLRASQLDAVFAKLADDTRDVMAKIPARPVPPMVHTPVDVQEKIGAYLLDAIGFDREAGLLFTSEHPFTSTIHQGDVRLTTHYILDDPRSSIFSVLHEGGHGIYDQGIAADLAGTNLADGASMGVHESQSRLWENIIGRSAAFWDVHFDKVNALAGGKLAANADEFTRAVNRVHPSLIRVEADEVTYNLHIIIRYELEKLIFTQGLHAADLPALWNEYYEKYLGVRPGNDAVGVMQDVHWSSALFGYFPTYALGNLYSAQIARAMEKNLGTPEKLIREEGGLARVKGWLTDKVYRYGRLEEPRDLIRRVTGEDVNGAYLIDYFRKKYL